jgi:hypothetical protein
LHFTHPNAKTSTTANNQQHIIYDAVTMVHWNLQFGTNAETLWTAAEATKKVAAATA